MSETVLCACGCGNPAPLAKKTDSRKGHVKGQPVKFLPDHHQKTMRSAGQSSNIGHATSPNEREITEADIDNLRSVDDIDAADALDARLQTIAKQTKRTFIEVGIICLEFTRRQLWSKIVDPKTGIYFHSVDAWIMERLGVSRSTAYEAMKVLQTGVAVADLQEMPRVNAKQLAKLSTKVQKDPTIIAAAKGTERDFRETVKTKYPEQHLEGQRAVIANLDDSAHDIVLDTFEMVKWIYDVSKREDIIENLCAYFRDGKCEREGYGKWTNAQAYQLEHGGRKA